MTLDLDTRMTVPENRLSLTKIIATLGPASAQPETVRRLIRAGVSVFRINFSHGDFASFQRMLDTVREVAESLGRHIGVMGDLSGPKVRIGRVVEGGVRLEKGQEVVFVKRSVVAGAEPGDVVFSTTCPAVIDEVEPGQTVLLDDGYIRLKCLQRRGESEDAELVCLALNSGLVTSSKGLNLPDTPLSVPALTDYDFECLRFVVEKRFDFVSLSFVRAADDVRLIKQLLRDLGARPQRPKAESLADVSRQRNYGAEVFIPVIAKIEKPQAIGVLGAIVREADVIMVARGDLGVEMDLAEVPMIQKRIIAECNDQGKPVIVATQMLQSMIDTPTPTRAEVTDVANAILDGADALMLSGETAIGKWPVEAVMVLRRVAMLTHQDRHRRPWPAKPRQSKYRTSALARGVGAVVEELQAPLVAIWSSFGGGASYLSQLRLPLPVLAFSASRQALRRMSIMYGITPRFMENPSLTLPFIAAVDALILEQEWASKGDPIVLVLGQPFGRPGLTNDLRIHYVGDVLED